MDDDFYDHPVPSRKLSFYLGASDLRIGCVSNECTTVVASLVMVLQSGSSAYWVIQPIKIPYFQS